jgi:hypothetical protein
MALRIIKIVIVLIATSVLVSGCGITGGQTPTVTAGPPTNPGPVSLAGNVLTVETGNLHAVFTSAALTSLVNKVTSESYIAQPGANWFTVNMLDPTDQALTAGTWQLTTNPASNQPMGQITFTDGTRTATLTVGIDPATDEMFVRTSGSSTSTGILSVFWGMLGFDFSSSRLVIPGQAGIYYSQTSSPDAVGLDYPTHWESGMAIYEASQGSLLIYANDGATPKFKGIRASRLSGNLDFGFEMFAVAPWENATSTPTFEWRMKGFAGDWKVPAAYYKNWWAQTGPQSSVSAPAWTKNIYGVVTIPSLDLPSLEALATEVIPSSTLLYLVSWRLSGYDINYPDYTPSPDVKAYIDSAHQLGFHVMLHTNMLGVSETNPNYPAMQSMQLKTPDSVQPMGWLWNLDPGDIHRVAYISPNYAPYRKLWITSVQQAVQQLNPDAIHLDAGGAIVNDGNGLQNGQNTIQGLIQFQNEIQAAFPGLALGYESTTEINSPFVRFAERWSEDVTPHPISTYLFGDQTLFYGFLDQPPPDEHQFIQYLKNYEGQGILPTARIGSLSDFDTTKPRMLQVLNQMNLWEQKQMVPDWGTNWNGALFRFKSLVDGSTAEVDQASSMITMNVANSPLYQRAINSSSRSAPPFITGWPAYDASTLYGLDPTDQYWLDPNATPAANTPHLSNLSSDVRVDTQTFVNSVFGLFSLAVNQPAGYDFIGNFYTASKGTMYLVPYLIYRGLELGAVAEVGPVIVGGTTYDSVLVMTPPFQGYVDGVTYTEFTVPLPNTQQVQFNFQVALSDSSIRTDPATFVVWINGQEVWRLSAGTGAWNPGTIDLSSFRGQTVQIRLISTPGPNNNPINDYTCWGNLSITTNLTRPGEKFTLTMPTGTGTAPYLPGINATPVSGQSNAFQITSDIPGNLLAFSSQPQQIPLGTDLLDLPYTKFSSTFDALPAVYQDTQNGIIMNNVGLGGVTLSRAIFTNPPANGRVYLNWTGVLPGSSTHLNFTFGLMDAPPGYTGATIAYSGADFLIFVNGQQAFDQTVPSAGTNTGSIDLSKWSGQAVVIQLAVDADGTAFFDWCLWTNVLLGP